jgi:hypothetical protein
VHAKQPTSALSGLVCSAHFSNRRHYFPAAQSLYICTCGDNDTAIAATSSQESTSNLYCDHGRSFSPSSNCNQYDSISSEGGYTDTTSEDIYLDTYVYNNHNESNF